MFEILTQDLKKMKKLLTRVVLPTHALTKLELPLTRNQNPPRPQAYGLVVLGDNGKAYAQHGSDVHLWNLDRAKLLLQFKAQNNSRIAAFHDSQLYLFGQNNRQIQVVHPDNGQLIEELSMQDSNIRCIAVNSEGNIYSDKDHSIVLRDRYSGQVLETVSTRAHQHTITSLVLDNKRGQLYSCSQGGEIKIWDTQTKQCLRTLNYTAPSAPYLSVNLSWDGDTFFTVKADGEVTHWTIETGEVIKTTLLFEQPKTPHAYSQVRLNQNGKSVVGISPIGAVLYNKDNETHVDVKMVSLKPYLLGLQAQLQHSKAMLTRYDELITSQLADATNQTLLESYHTLNQCVTKVETALSRETKDKEEKRHFLTLAQSSNLINRALIELGDSLEKFVDALTHLEIECALKPNKLQENYTIKSLTVAIEKNHQKNIRRHLTHLINLSGVVLVEIKTIEALPYSENQLRDRGALMTMEAFWSAVEHLTQRETPYSKKIIQHWLQQLTAWNKAWCKGTLPNESEVHRNLEQRLIDAVVHQWRLSKKAQAPLPASLQKLFAKKKQATLLKNSRSVLQQSSDGELETVFSTHLLEKYQTDLTLKETFRAYHQRSVIHQALTKQLNQASGEKLIQSIKEALLAQLEKGQLPEILATWLVKEAQAHKEKACGTQVVFNMKPYFESAIHSLYTKQHDIASTQVIACALEATLNNVVEHVSLSNEEQIKVEGTMAALLVTEFKADRITDTRLNLFLQTTLNEVLLSVSPNTPAINTDSIEKDVVEQVLHSNALSSKAKSYMDKARQHLLEPALLKLKKFAYPITYIVSLEQQLAHQSNDIHTLKQQVAVLTQSARNHTEQTTESSSALQFLPSIGQRESTVLDVAKLPDKTKVLAVTQTPMDDHHDQTSTRQDNSTI